MRRTSRDMDLRAVLRLLKNLGEAGVEYVLVGAAALNVLGIVRATEDIDLFIQANVSNIEKLKNALRATWDDPAIEEIQPEDLLSEYSVIRYGPPEGALTVDVLLRLGEAFRYEDLEWETRDLDGVPIRVATPRTLWRMKVSTLRAQDHVDAAMLKERFGIQEEDGGR
jgi:hypothetical protein